MSSYKTLSKVPANPWIVVDSVAVKETLRYLELSIDSEGRGLGWEN
jgi:hypothetical protein